MFECLGIDILEMAYVFQFIVMFFIDLSLHLQLSLCFDVFQVKKLNSMIAEKKTALAPIIKELRSLRQQRGVSIIRSLAPIVFVLI